MITRFGPAWNDGEGLIPRDHGAPRRAPAHLYTDTLGRLLAELVAIAVRGKQPSDHAGALAEHCTLELRELNADESRAFMKDVYRKLSYMIDRRVPHKKIN